MSSTSMVPTASGFVRYNNHLDRSHQHEQQCCPDDLFPFPGFNPNYNNNVEDSTPIAKVPCDSVLNHTNSPKSTEGSSSTNATKTPPVEPSVSPEIQSGLCHSVLVSGATPTCYGAGHVVSGVTDKRKCRPRGILSVGCTSSFESNKENFNSLSYEESGQEVFRKPKPSLIPLPTEASISWHLSPSHVDANDDIEEKGDYENGLNESPNGPHGSTLKNIEFHGFYESSSDKLIRNSQEERTSAYDFSGECSPFSVDSLSSGNVMQTPSPDSSSERQKLQLKHQFESKYSPRDPSISSPELADFSSFSNSTDHNNITKNSDNRAFRISDSTLEDMSESQIHIFWKDGLTSSTFDTDDFDCCRLLSDGENDGDEHKLLNGARVNGNKKEIVSPSGLNSCAESICTDGGGLIASRDSDWTLHYKDQSFEL